MPRADPKIPFHIDYLCVHHATLFAGSSSTSRLESCKRLTVTVAKGSVIHVHRNVYSVHSRLLSQRVEVRIYAEHLEVWYGQQRVEQLPRLRGRDKHCINYRHIIDWLVRKPGAFAGYRYPSDGSVAVEPLYQTNADFPGYEVGGTA